MVPSSLCHEPIIELDNISFSYEDRMVLHHVNLTVQQRDFVSVIAANGAGKTTLLRIIVGLLKPTSGEIRLFGEPVRTFKQWHRIGYVSQKNKIGTLFPATVREVVLSGLYNGGRLYKWTTAADKQRAEEAMAAMDISDLADLQVGKLSGGQQQRVFLARALINNPSLLILDEPMTGLDRQTQESFFHMIKHMHSRHNITFLLVSHDVDLIRSYVGEEPRHTVGKLNFFVKHSHDLDDCCETDLSHSLREWHDVHREWVSATS